jgi:hypothetical protein
LLIIFYLIAIFEFNEPGGPSSADFANSSLISLYDATALNPAILPRIGNNGLALVYTKPFGISNLSYNRAIINLNRPALGFSFSSLGQTGYHEHTFTLAAGFALNKNFSYGIILKGYHVDISYYGNDFFPSLNLGILFMQNTYRLAIVVGDINNPKSKQGDLIPASLQIGGSLLPVKGFSLSCDFFKNVDYERFLTGVEFNLLPIFSLRFGIATNPYVIAGGFAISFKNFRFDYGYRYHPSLKETQILSLNLKT